MPVTILDPRKVDRLRAQALTYDPAGGTRDGHTPDGFHAVSATRVLRPGSDLDRAGEALFSWQVPLRAGLRVAASAPVLGEDDVVLMRLGLGPASLRIPCRVVYVLDEPDRRGFAYGTLPGHPESGEEAFVLERRPDGRVEFRITAFSRPATVLARAGGPLGRGFQRLMTTRYLGTLDR